MISSWIFAVYFHVTVITRKCASPRCRKHLSTPSHPSAPCPSCPLPPSQAANITLATQTPNPTGPHPPSEAAAEPQEALQLPLLKYAPLPLPPNQAKLPETPTPLGEVVVVGGSM